MILNNLQICNFTPSHTFPASLNDSWCTINNAVHWVLDYKQDWAVYNVDWTVEDATTWIKYFNVIEKMWPNFSSLYLPWNNAIFCSMDQERLLPLRHGQRSKTFVSKIIKFENMQHETLSQVICPFYILFGCCKLHLSILHPLWCCKQAAFLWQMLRSIEIGCVFICLLHWGWFVWLSVSVHMCSLSAVSLDLLTTSVVQEQLKQLFPLPIQGLVRFFFPGSRRPHAPWI